MAKDQETLVVEEPVKPQVKTQEEQIQVAKEEPKPPEAVPGKWFVWLLPSGAVSRPKLVVAARTKEEAWDKFCQANGVSPSIEGGRVVRPALDREVKA